VVATNLVRHARASISRVRALAAQLASLAESARTHAAPLALGAGAALAGYGILASTVPACSREPSSDVVAEPTPNVPSDVMFYAHVLYGGDDAYLVEGKWYRPGANGWTVFTEEPLELALVRRTTEKGHASSWF
jgi:hypothetical protein